MSWFVPQVGNHSYKGLFYVFLWSLHYICIIRKCKYCPLVRISESLMTFSIAKLKGRQTEAPPCLGHFMTFKGWDRSACTLTNTGCLTLLVSSVSPAHQRFHAILWKWSAIICSLYHMVYQNRWFPMFCSPVFARIWINRWFSDAHSTLVVTNNIFCIM